MDKYDFSGWATKNNIRCSDGRTIRRDAFIDCDGKTVPLVWNHTHNDAFNVLGHADLENRDEGVYAYCYLNNTDAGRNAAEYVKHGDITSMSIYANHLKHNGADVVHGEICEVSLVLKGANPGAFIDSVMIHGDDSDEEAIIYTGENFYLPVEEESIQHSDEKPQEEIIEHADKEEKVAKEQDTDDSEETLADIIDTMSDKQKNALYATVALAVEQAQEGDTDEGEDEDMKHNVFDDEGGYEEVLSHSDMEEIFRDAKRCGSLKDAVVSHGLEDISYLAHAEQNYGIRNIDYLFPEVHNLNQPPEFIKRDQGWVSVVMGGVHKTPFSRIRSTFADITEDEARALGYIKGNLKKEEVFGLLKRSTTPQTIYKKQKLDRDDVIDITDFDVVAWLKSEMRMMLDEEIARATLFGDGRPVSSDDHISHEHIRPAWLDEALYTIKVKYAAPAGGDANEAARQFIRTVVKARKDYKGSGNPVMFTTEDQLTDLLLMEDKNGRMIYESEEKLRSVLRVSRIVTVPVMENLTREEGGKNVKLDALILNLKDYNIGADRGGAVSMFDDFDIDYNQQKYLIETRCSGALIKPYSCIAVESDVEPSVAG